VLILDNAVFLHVPKTGGTWVEHALRAGGVPFTALLHDGDRHGDLSYSPHPERFTFAYVRHPLTLYQSYWRFKAQHGWDAFNPFDVECREDGFEQFVRRVLDLYPGWCSKTFTDYVGPSDQPIAFVGRFESLADDLVAALERSGHAFDEAALRSTAPANVSTTPLACCRWTSGLSAEVADAEAEAMNRFSYGLLPI
jgi:hypothetical protein